MLLCFFLQNREEIEFLNYKINVSLKLNSYSFLPPEHFSWREASTCEESTAFSLRSYKINVFCVNNIKVGNFVEALIIKKESFFPPMLRASSIDSGSFLNASSSSKTSRHIFYQIPSLPKVTFRASQGKGRQAHRPLWRPLP